MVLAWSPWGLMMARLVWPVWLMEAPSPSVRSVTMRVATVYRTIKRAKAQAEGTS